MAAAVLKSISWTSTTGTIVSNGKIYANAGDTITITYTWAAGTGMHAGDKIKLSNGGFAALSSQGNTVTTTFTYTVPADSTIDTASLTQTDTRIYSANNVPYDTTKNYDTTAVATSAPASTLVIDTTNPAAPTITAITTDGGVVGDHLTNDTSLTVSGTAEANSTVKLFQDGAQVGSATADGSGNWSIADANILANATTYQFTATATDVAGNTGPASASYAATIDTVAPVVTSASATNATVKLGQTATFVLNVDVATVANPSATLSLSNGATALYDSGASTPTRLVFNYTVATGDATSSDVTVTAVHGVTDSAGNAVSYSGNPTGTTNILCYLRGTRLMTAHGEVPVENLREGDLLVCRFGGLRPIRWIGRQTRRGALALGSEPIRFEPDSLGPNLPRHALYVTPGHSMLIGETLVLARNLVNGVTITQAPPGEEWAYFQVDFGIHDCVLAEGCWSEAFADASTLRRDFDNAAEFHRRFPGYQAPPDVSLCAPRPLSGPDLDAALRAPVQRAAASAPPGKLFAWIDRITTAGSIEGWAIDQSHPDLPVLLEIWVADEVRGTVLACQYRADLEPQGNGRGQHAFVFDTGRCLTRAEMDTVVVRRVADGVEAHITDDCRARFPAPRLQTALSAVS